MQLRRGSREMRLEERDLDKETDIATLQASWQVEGGSCPFSFCFFLVLFAILENDCACDFARVCVCLCLSVNLSVSVVFKIAIFGRNLLLMTLI